VLLGSYDRYKVCVGGGVCGVFDCLCVCECVHVSVVSLIVCLSVCLSVCLCVSVVCLIACLCVCVCVCVCVSVSVCVFVRVSVWYVCGVCACGVNGSDCMLTLLFNIISIDFTVFYSTLSRFDLITSSSLFYHHFFSPYFVLSSS
jgi:hypothetical protein